MIGWCWKRWGAGCGEIFGRKVVDVPSIVERAHNLLDCDAFDRVEARGNLLSTKLLSTESEGNW